jgi:hypothetical protein
VTTVAGTPHPVRVAARAPLQEPGAGDEPRVAAAQDERAVGQLAERGLAIGPEALLVQAGVDRVRTRLADELEEPPVVLAPAERTRPVAGGECRRLVEKEELREPAGLQQRRAAPALELEPAADPAPRREPAADPAAGIVETAAVAVDRAARGIGDQVAERRDAVLERHAGTIKGSASGRFRGHVSRS